jgi:hypothetical protein
MHNGMRYITPMPHHNGAATTAKGSNMATTKTATAATTGKATPAPAAPAATTVGGVALPAPTGPLYLPNSKHPQWGRVQPASHRAYAQAVATALASAMPQGFALNQYRAALSGNVLPTAHPQRNVPAPTCTWAKHNMPTWAKGQGWLVAAQG